MPRSLSQKDQIMNKAMEAYVELYPDPKDWKTVLDDDGIPHQYHAEGFIQAYEMFKPEWFEVRHKPEINQDVLVCYEKDDELIQAVSHWTGDYWYKLNLYNVTHWMPLPSNPEE